MTVDTQTDFEVFLAGFLPFTLDATAGRSPLLPL